MDDNVTVTMPVNEEDWEILMETEVEKVLGTSDIKVIVTGVS